MVFTASGFFICDSMSQFNDGKKFSEDKVKKHISKELITRIIKLEYEKLLLLKSPQNIVIYCDI